MSGLPEGWEADYNGSRWFYRYKATGLTRFTFPKAGDEFPEYIGTGSEEFDLAPEERLASEQQVKRRSTLDGTQSDSKPSDNRRRHDPLDGIDEMSATGYFDPASFMYFGPETNSDDVPVTNARSDTDSGQKANVVVAQADSEVSSLTATPNPVQNATLVTADSPPPCGHVISSHTTGDSVANSFSTHITPQLNEPEVPMLDGQPIYAELSSVASNTTINTQPPCLDDMAELATDDTAKCADELAPVELDASTKPTWLNSGNSQMKSPVELPTEKDHSIIQQSSPQQTSTNIGVLDSYPLVSASFSFPPLPQKGIPLPAGTHQTSTEADTRDADRKTQMTDASKHRDIHQSFSNVDQALHTTTQTSSQSSQIMSENPEVPTQKMIPSVFRPYEKSVIGASSASKGVQRHPTVLTPSAAPKSPTRLEVEKTPNRPPQSPIPAVLQPGRRPVHPFMRDQAVSQAHTQTSGEIMRHESAPLDLANSLEANEAAQTSIYISTTSKPATRQNMPPSDGKSNRPVSLPVERHTYPAAHQHSEQPAPLGNVFRPVEYQKSRPPAFRYVTENSNADNYEPRPILHKAKTAPEQPPSQNFHRPSLNGPGLLIFQDFSSIPASSAKRQSLPSRAAQSGAQPSRDIEVMPHRNQAPDIGSTPGSNETLANDPAIRITSLAANENFVTQDNADMDQRHVSSGGRLSLSSENRIATGSVEGLPSGSADYSGSGWGDEW